MDLPFADETILARWLSGELTDAERRQVEEHPGFTDWQRIAQDSKRLQAPVYDEATNWKKLQQPVNDTNNMTVVGFQFAMPPKLHELLKILHGARLITLILFRTKH